MIIFLTAGSSRFKGVLRKNFGERDRQPVEELSTCKQEINTTATARKTSKVIVEQEEVWNFF